ncbi:hypothetical protein N5E99_09345 [Pseudomonas chengduensis]|jgi:hypothetical protein|uniref:Lipoprotein n=2 Tax=Pseudomonadaceae TaxID=135621 RepID=A0A1H2N7W4_9PSED|nr:MULTISPECIES: hypothetical protein [Pseudomonas]KQO44075.1 hypothetical protein ASF15_02145 [Pseudomonas sp. Leaf83]MDH0957956.1 hypothetical protein [Pseudomonas chengduensis]MDH1535956.1 hypothetical protein [Pseudomonas chengduensis]MDH1557428.1 hypothetical protein [Pseudomonas chengduensis]MDH1624050.1 hypothetical protein [Pseudomonas chengduensis]
MMRHGNPTWLLIGTLPFALSACSSLAPLTGERFTLEGELPADFALKAQAHYDVANNCNGRSQARSFESDFQSTPQQYRFNIPVSYRDGLCAMRLGRVGLFIHGRYGDKDWQRTYDNGGLTLVETLPPGAPSFGADGTVTKQAECTWLFQLSKAHSRQGQISKLLNCKGAGAYLVADELPGKTVRLDFQMTGEERPYMRGYWIKTPSGWKPCTGRWGTQFEELCTEPPQFRTFQMNGQECTVYPNCTE